MEEPILTLTLGCGGEQLPWELTRCRPVFKGVWCQLSHHGVA